MANTTFNISELYEAAFGLGRSRLPMKFETSSEDTSDKDFTFKISEEPNKDSIIKFDIPVINDLEQANEQSSLGTPILFPITFEGRKYNIYDQDGRIVQKDMKTFRLPISTICEFSLSKIDTITPLSGGVGSVKELYGFGDWNINIKGLCFPDPSHPQVSSPYEQDRILTEWKMLADSVDVTGELFLSKGIHQIYIKDIKTSQLAGKPNFIPFEITAYSDKFIDLFNPSF
jgi:hypothetical protein